MKVVVLAAGLVMTATACVFSQAKFRKFPPSINHPSLNVFAPSLSADGDAIVFVSDNAEDRVLTPFYSFRNGGTWNEPRPFPATIYSRLNFLYGFSLSADGNTIYYSTLKSPGVGGFDIWTAQWTGSGWSAPTNPGMPLNSRSHEACLSGTPDGTTFYFMRCESMDQNTASKCKILMISRRANGSWTEPEELPEYINKGNAQSPRILADGQTLIFSSDQFPGGKGGMDLYMSRISNGEWSRPVPLDFVNTEGNDQYVSVIAVGRYLIRDVKGERRNEIVEYLIPDHLRPRSMMKLIGSAMDREGKPAPAYVSVIEKNSGERFYSGRPGPNGRFVVYLREGGYYEVAVDPEKDHLSYFVKSFDLTGETIPQLERLQAVIKPPEPDDELVLDMFVPEPRSSEVKFSGSAADMRRMMRMLNANPQLGVEVQVLMEGYRQDSIQSDPDLTELVTDSVLYTYDEIDSLGQLFQKDTVVIETTWHNDRTWKQAENVGARLIAEGLDPARLTYLGNSIPAGEEGEKKITIKGRLTRRQDE